MNSNHKPGFFLRFCLVLIFLLSAGSLIVSNGSKLYADDENASEEVTQKVDDETMPENIAQKADDEKMTEEMAKKIKELEIITIDNKGYEKDRKGPAEFDHVKHARNYSISCWECHHEYKDDQDKEQSVEKGQTEQTAQKEQTEQDEQVVRDEKIEEGEQPAEKEEPTPKYLTAQNIWSPWGITKKCIECHDPKEKKDDVIVLQAAYHLNCKTCHMEKRIYGNDILAYRKCTTCHKD